MSGLYFVVPTLFAVLVSMLVVRAGAIALIMTGMNIDRAKFQALSAFSGTGFTTHDAEAAVSNPTRRRIISWLMILGHAGVVTVIVTATSTLVTSKGLGVPVSAIVLVVGIGLVYLIATRTGVIKKWEVYVQGRLGRSAVFDEKPIDELLHLHEGYGLARVRLKADNPLVGKTLVELPLRAAGCLVLAIERTTGLIMTPNGSSTFEAGDGVVIYGKLTEMQTLIGTAEITRGY